MPHVELPQAEFKVGTWLDRLLCLLIFVCSGNEGPSIGWQQRDSMKAQ